MAANISQGAVLEPLLWSLMYNGLLGLRMLKETTLIRFAGDMAVVIVAKHSDDKKLEANLITNRSKTNTGKILGW